jgi:hypothetical protein
MLEIIDGLQTNRESDQAIGNSKPLAVSRVVTGMRHGGRLLDQGFDRA